eukprot:TRINITY_DN107800_c0_g1_i1.p3 TRINITY_DN107800_c0_g1~~TRINITY_DN107800_c0_g1_i1.p3  ORF type:complete len:113 (+),score=1.37 TRINITY_DN107800_c0_g1_i1:53-391(+)
MADQVQTLDSKLSSVIGKTEALNPTGFSAFLMPKIEFFWGQFGGHTSFSSLLMLSPLFGVLSRKKVLVPPRRGDLRLFSSAVRTQEDSGRLPRPDVRSSLFQNCLFGRRASQ